MTDRLQRRPARERPPPPVDALHPDVGDQPIPVIVRGEGVWVYDQYGKRYLDGLSGLFTSQVGHGRTELAEAAARQAGQLAYFPVWSYAHPMAIELADRLAELTPGDCNRIFFTTGGSEAVESAWKLARQYFRVTGQPERYKVISRNIAYHGATMGALSITGLAEIKTPFEPLVPGPSRCPTPTSTGPPTSPTTSTPSAGGRPTPSSRPSSSRGPRRWRRCSSSRSRTPGAASPRLPATSSGCGRSATATACCWCPTRSSAPSADWGTGSGPSATTTEPDIVTMAKGLTSGYSPLGAMAVSDRLVRAVPAGRELPPRGDLRRAPGQRGGGPGQPGRLREGGAARERAGQRGRLQGGARHAGDLPIVGDVRGAGYFYGIELVKDKDTRETFSDDESERLLRGFLSGALYEAGLICRADDRGDPVVQLAPPLTCGEEEFEVMTTILRSVLTEAWKQL
jgi:adenosylmethionine-8-amino-7-oxononanoate aminotransferase